MTLIVDPDDLSQGAVTAVADAVFSSASGASVTITSATNALPALTANMYFEIREHSNSNNNGLYQVTTVTTSTTEYIVSKITGSNPADAASEAIQTLGSTGASNAKSIHYDLAARTIYILTQGNVSNDGVTEQAVYSFTKEEWKDDSTLIPHPFPFVAITPEQFEIVFNWEWADNTVRKLVRTGGWREIDLDSNIKREYAGIITLGTFEDSATDLAYYQVGDDPTDTGAAIDFAFAGPVNEAILTFNEILGPSASLNFNANNQLTRGTGSWIDDGVKIGAHITIRDAENSQNDGTFAVTDVTATVITVSGTPFATNADDDTAVVAVNYRSAIKLFLRVRDGDTNGKTFAQATLDDIGVTSVDNKVFRFPLSNATDLKIEETDANIAANSPYTQILIRYFDQAFSRDIDLVGTPRDFGIVIDVGTFSGVDGSTTASGNTLTSAEGNIPGTTYDGGTLTIHEGTNKGTYTITSASGTTVTISTTFANTLSNQSFTLQRSTPIDATAEEIYEKVQYLLRQEADIDSTDQTVTGSTADDLLVFVGDTLVTGRSIPNNPNGGGSGVVIEGFSSNDTNRLTFTDNSAVERTYPFVAAGTINFNTNLVNDGFAEYWMFFEYTERFTNTGFAITSASGSTATISSSTTNLTTELASGDYINLQGFSNTTNNGIWELTGTPAGSGPYTVAARKWDGATVVDEAAGPSVSLDKNPINSPDAIIVQDNNDANITGTIGGATVSFSFDYDGNVQGGRTAATDAAIRLRAIGLNTAQFVETTGTITRNTGLTFSLVAGLERNYSNP